jgi:hypothetical protein
LLDNVLATKRGDADLNGRIEFADFLALAQAFATPGAKGWQEGDFDGDEEVTFADFLLLASNFASMP